MEGNKVRSIVQVLAGAGHSTAVVSALAHCHASFVQFPVGNGEAEPKAGAGTSDRKGWYLVHQHDQRR